MAQKTKVLVVYGGRSAEHEVSCRSASFVLKNLDRSKYDVEAIAIAKDGTWLPQDMKALEPFYDGTIPIPQDKPLRMTPQLPIEVQATATSVGALQLKGSAEEAGVQDLVIFPVLHGTFGEDGTLQGVFDLAEQAYVGPDTLGSAAAMDKGVAKRLVESRGIKVGPFIELRQERWQRAQKEVIEDVAAKLKAPWFVKPANLGSSVGITRVKNTDELAAAIDYAFEFDEKILVEEGIAAREFEVALLGGYEPKASVPGEVVPEGDKFYSYEVKYLDEHGAKIEVPAKMLPEKATELQRLSIEAFQAMELYGMARVDWFMDTKTGEFLFNEVNTIPGMTSISQYPKLWEYSGIGAAQLLDELVQLALRRKASRRNLKRIRD